VLRRADGIRVVSRRIQKSIEARMQPKRLAVLPIFVDIGRFGGPQADAALASKFARFPTRILFVGRLESEKDPSLAVRSFAGAAPADSCLIVVGSGSGRGQLGKLAEELGVADRVFFEGERDSAPYYKVADLVLCTSRYEGYGLVIIEALGSGKPVLSTDVGVAREAGAIITSREAFAKSLGEWFDGGPREARLRSYPYHDFDEYVVAYTREITALKK